VRSFDEDQAEQFWKFLIEEKFVRADTRQTAVKLAFEAGSHLFGIAFRESQSGDDVVISEARRLLKAYLATYA
jgi:Tetracyclin repressor-like, C-terminal domain